MFGFLEKTKKHKTNEKKNKKTSQLLHIFPMELGVPRKSQKGQC